MKFEFELQISAKEYVEIWTTMSPKTWRKIARRLMLLAIAAACFLWEYTVGVGVVILILTIIGVLMPRYFPGTTRKTYHDTPILKKTMTYGLDTDSIWVKAEGYFSKINWKHISMWRERNGLLVLQSYGKLPFYYRIDDLKQLGIYSKVMEMVKKNAKSYDK